MQDVKMRLVRNKMAANFIEKKIFLEPKKCGVKARFV